MDRKIKEPKCKYCGRSLKGADTYRRSEHVKICKNVDDEVRQIHSGIDQSEWKNKNG